MKTLESKTNVITEEIFALKEQIDKATADAKKFTAHNLTSAQALRWITERLLYIEQLKRTLRNLEFRTLSKEQRALIRSLSAKLEDVAKLLKGYEKSSLIDKSAERTLAQFSKSRQRCNKSVYSEKKDYSERNDYSSLVNTSMSYESNRSAKDLGRLKAENGFTEMPKTYRESRKSVAQHVKGSYSMIGNYNDLTTKTQHTSVKAKRNSYSNINASEADALSLLGERQVSQRVESTFNLSHELAKEKRLNKIVASEFNKLKTEHEIFVAKFNEQEASLNNISKEFRMNEEMVKRLSEDNATLAKRYDELFANYNSMKSMTIHDSTKITKYKTKANEQESEMKNLKEQIVLLKQELVTFNLKLAQPTGDSGDAVKRRLAAKAGSARDDIDASAGRQKQAHGVTGRA
eukprot:TRINITY_DN3191_c0_g2_i2.p1 TRINITY_DN3191_c0_g2~~TRINITY_DN3191_c0_g2_i2.p1  ORF type:complete len:405 (+),score=88.62 TRINITY_DN3191_c0_g2_i2:74-1288(+)